MELSIVGIGVGQISFVEYYSYAVMNDFQTYAQQMQTAYKNVQAAISAGQTPSSDDYDTLVDSLKQMQELAQNGRQISNGSETYPSYMTSDMASVLTSVTQTLDKVGITASSSTTISDADKSQALTNWISQGTTDKVNISQNIQNAANFVANMEQYVIQVPQSGTGTLIDLQVQGSPTRSLQSMLGLEYVASGNATMSVHMNELEQALAVSQSTLSSLQTLQNVANQIQVSVPSPAFQFPPDDSDDLTSPPGYIAKVVMNNSTLLGTVFDGGTTLSKNSTGTQVATALQKVYATLSAADQATMLQKLDISQITDLTTDAMVGQKNGHNGFKISDYYTNATVVSAAVADYQSQYGTVSQKINDTIGNDPDKFSDMYKAMASAYFSQLFPSASPLPTSANLLLSARAAIQNQITSLQNSMSAITASEQTIAGTLYDSLKQVLGDLNQAFSGVDVTNAAALSNATQKWILDNQDQTIAADGSQGSAGEIATNLQTAIGDAESLEERQKEDVRSYLYVFQEFYNTAGTMIEAITEMIEKMSENTKGSS
jgi:hypothetical protein